MTLYDQEFISFITKEAKKQNKTTRNAEELMFNIDSVRDDNKLSISTMGFSNNPQNVLFLNI